MAARRGADTEYKKKSEATRLLRRLFDAKMRRLATVPLILVLFGTGTWWMWKRYGDQVLAHPSYQLDPKAIKCTDQPDWLLTDILPKVIRDGSLESLQIHQPDLTVQVAGAFEHHPWVRRVQRVRKRYPAGVEVELSYRFPVGMVVVAEGLQPIDGEGVALPGYIWVTTGDVQTKQDYIAPEFAQLFPRIFVGQTSPLGQGVGWGDPVVVDAAKLAEFLQADWAALRNVLDQIQLNRQPTSTVSSPKFVILGRPQPGGKPSLIVHWGRAPGKESAGEPSAQTKLAKIKDWLADAQRSGSPRTGDIDVSSIRALSAMTTGRGTRH